MTSLANWGNVAEPNWDLATLLCSAGGGKGFWQRDHYTRSTTPGLFHFDLQPNAQIDPVLDPQRRTVNLAFLADAQV